MDQRVIDYLTKQLSIDKNVVTYRSLSRKFDLHVNTAKNHLVIYASTSSWGQTHATYLITGQIPSAKPANPKSTNGDVDMDVDMENTPHLEQDDGEDVPCTKVLLVSERDLLSARSQFTRIFSEHIYSLSPAPLTDAGLICDPSPMIWVQDAAKSKEAFALLGCVTGPHVQSGKASAAVASSSKITIKPKEPIMKRAPAPSTTTPTKEEEKSSKTKLEVEPKAKELPKTKPTGRLDWSKTKPKLKEASKPVEPEKGAKTRARVDDAKAKGDAAKSKAQADLRKVKKEPSPDTSDEKISEESDPSKSRPKRGTKRKSVLPTLSDSEEDEEPSQKDQIGKITARVKKNVILSDDDEEPDDIPARRRLTGAKAKGKAKASLSDTEADKSVRAMMDIDDDEVIKASRPESRVQEDEDAQTEDAEVVQDSEPERAKLNPKKRKEKKVVPVGRNGLKKKRVMKTRTKIDEKGYMVTEDYSSYESVDDDEPEAAVEAPVKKGRAAKPKQKATESKLKPKEPREEARSTKSSEPVKRATGKGSGQGNITNFFGKAK